jgi:hypothetical protein
LFNDVLEMLLCKIRKRKEIELEVTMRGLAEEWVGGEGAIME